MESRGLSVRQIFLACDEQIPRRRFYEFLEGARVPQGKGFEVIIRPPENSKIPQKKEKQIIEAYLREQGVLLE